MLFRMTATKAVLLSGFSKAKSKWRLQTFVYAFGSTHVKIAV